MKTKNEAGRKTKYLLIEISAKQNGCKNCTFFGNEICRKWRLCKEDSCPIYNGKEVVEINNSLSKAIGGGRVFKVKEDK